MTRASLWTGLLFAVGCGAPPPAYVGDWERTASVATAHELDGTPTEWCSLSDQQLTLGEDGTWVLVDHTEPDLQVTCSEAPPDPVTITTSGQYAEVVLDEAGTTALAFTQSLEIVDAERDRDDSETAFQLDFMSVLAVGDNPDDPWLWLDGIGVFRRAGSK